VEQLVDLQISDLEWLQVMQDLEDLHMYEALVTNLKYRTHLMQQKRALGLQHLVLDN